MGDQAIGGYVCTRLSARLSIRAKPRLYKIRKLTLIFFFEFSSDADSDVLADYVLALIRSDAPDEEIRQASIENLEDFLKES